MESLHWNKDTIDIDPILQNVLPEQGLKYILRYMMRERVAT
jgi:hypothetical protein